MQRTFCFLKYVLIIAVILIVTSPSAFADTILTYNGLPLSVFSNNFPVPSENNPYTHLTATFELEAPLPSYFGPTPDDFQVNPISFTISDGIDTITNRTATAFYFQFGLASEPTNSGSSEADDIMGWTIIADAVIGGTPLELFSQGGWDVPGADPCVDCVGIINGPMNPLNQGATLIAGTNQGAGQWTIPEPASLPLLLLTIAVASVAIFVHD